jgi:hypothetical protein
MDRTRTYHVFRCGGYHHEIALSSLTVRSWTYTRTAVSTVSDIAEVFYLGISDAQVEIDKEKLARHRIQREVVSDGAADFADADDGHSRC